MSLSLFSFFPALYLLIPFAYIMGSIPFGLLATRNRGVDLRTTGSKNIGATNVLRTAGKIPAILTLTGDVLKGAVPVMICNYILIHMDLQTEDESFLRNAKDLWGALVGIAAVAGHVFSIFLSFRGGKGVATGFGVLIAYSPFTALITLLTWICVAAATKYSSLAAIVSVSVLPVIFALLDFSMIRVSFGLLIAILIIYRHRSNIKSLLDGQESKIGNKK